MDRTTGLAERSSLDSESTLVVTVRCRRSRIGGGVRYSGRRLLPDVDERCADVASAITPRVGGVGPTIVAMLFRNAVRAAAAASR